MSMFDVIDRNHDGVITRSEFQQAMMGRRGGPPAAMGPPVGLPPAVMGPPMGLPPVAMGPPMRPQSAFVGPVSGPAIASDPRAIGIQTGYASAFSTPTAVVAPTAVAAPPPVVATPVMAQQTLVAPPVMVPPVQQVVAQPVQQQVIAQPVVQKVVAQPVQQQVVAVQAQPVVTAAPVVERAIRVERPAQVQAVPAIQKQQMKVSGERVVGERPITREELASTGNLVEGPAQRAERSFGEVASSFGYSATSIERTRVESYAPARELGSSLRGGIGGYSTSALEVKATTLPTRPSALSTTYAKPIEKYAPTTTYATPASLQVSSGAATRYARPVEKSSYSTAPTARAGYSSGLSAVGMTTPARSVGTTFGTTGVSRPGGSPIAVI